MNDISIQLKEAISILSIPHDALIECNLANATEIINEAQSLFVQGNPRRWWLSLKLPYQVFNFPDASGHLHLKDCLPSKDDRCWIIVDDDDIEMPVFDVKIEYLTGLISECNYFEYYLLSKKFEWLLIENDHNQLIFSERCQG